MHAYGLAVLRLVVGVVFIAHGAQKLFGIWGGDGLAATAGQFEQLGLRPSYALAVLVGVVEFGGGLMLMAGALTPVVSLALVVTMAVAIWKVHGANGFFINWANTPGQGHGFEYNLLLIGALGALALGGPGAFSHDGHRARSAEAEAAGRARLRAGKV